MRVRILGYVLENRRNEKCITSLSFFALVIKVVDGVVVVLPSNDKRKFISFAQGPTLCFLCLAHHACYSNRWKLCAIQ